MDAQIELKKSIEKNIEAINNTSSLYSLNIKGLSFVKLRFFKFMANLSDLHSKELDSQIPPLYTLRIVELSKGKLKFFKFICKLLSLSFKESTDPMYGPEFIAKMKRSEEDIKAGRVRVIEDIKRYLEYREMKVIFTDEADDDIQFWNKTNNKAILNKIEKLIEDIRLSPYEGLG